MISGRSSTAVGRGALAIAALWLGVAWPAAARAQTDPAAAEMLFREGKAAFERKDFDAACPKLAESQRLNPASGTMLALAACHEEQGKLASAWGEYTSAVALARRDGSLRREKAAAARAAALEAKLSYVTFSVDPRTASLEGLELKRDGIVIGAAGWHDVPTDPGMHKLEVTAPQRKPFHLEFNVAGHSTKVEVPLLEEERPTVAPVGQVPPQSTPGAGPDLRDLGIVVGSAGIVSLGVGTVFGAMAIAASKSAKSKCTPSLCTDPTAVTDNNHAKTFADISTVTFVAGIASVTGGAAMVLFSNPKADSKAVALRVDAGPGLAFARIEGVF